MIIITGIDQAFREFDGMTTKPVKVTTKTDASGKVRVKSRDTAPKHARIARDNKATRAAKAWGKAAGK